MVFQQQKEIVEKVTRVKIRRLNSESNPFYGMTTLTLQFPTYSTSAKAHKFVVVDDRMMPFCVILGANFLASLNVNMDFALLRCEQESTILHHFQLNTSRVSIGLLDEPSNRTARLFYFALVQLLINLQCWIM